LIVGLISHANADRLKDLTSISGIRDNPLVGYGIVVGLAGSGDGNSGLLLQSMQAMVSQFGLVTNTAGLSGKNAAAVMVTAELPAFSKPGQAIDITVSTLGAAKSLRGGTLLMTPLKGADGDTYAIAQGNLVVGGLGVEGGDGSSIIVNIPTVGRIPKGATVEKMVESPFLNSDVLVLNLNQSDFSTASRVSEVSVPLDSSSIKVRAPIDKAQKVSFMSLLENVEVQPASPAAKVVVNARTGTIVIGGDVRVTPAVVTHGSLTVRVKEDMKTTQQQNIVTNGQNAIVAGGAAVQTPDSDLGFEAETARAFVFDTGVELSDIVDAVNNVGASAADLVSILDALRQAGALRAEILVI
jgi:flagellar P-ring protein precursor FlgI